MGPDEIRQWATEKSLELYRQRGGGRVIAEAELPYVLDMANTLALFIEDGKLPEKPIKE